MPVSTCSLRNVLLVTAMAMTTQCYGQWAAPDSDPYLSALLPGKDAYLVVSASSVCGFNVKEDLFDSRFAEAIKKAGVLGSNDKKKLLLDSLGTLTRSEMQKPENLGTNPSRETRDRWCTKMKAEASKQGVLLPATADAQPPGPAARTSPGIPPRPTIADLDSAESSIAELWTRLPFQARHVIFLSEPATGFGAYKQRASNIFAPGEAMVTYLEPVGYGWKTLGSDSFSLGMVVDGEILGQDRTVVGGQKSFARMDVVSHHRNRELFFTLTMSVNDIPPGNYVLAYTLHDIGDSSRTTRVEQTFSVKAPG